jgi:two-component sensor histidine kinase
LVIPKFAPMTDHHLTPAQKRSLCRFLEEALCNVGKHAVAATKLWVFCGQENGDQVVRVTDNGTGMVALIDTAVGTPLDRTTDSATGLGTRQAIGLAKQLRGTFRRMPHAPQGTVCELRWPVAKRGFW